MITGFGQNANDAGLTRIPQMQMTQRWETGFDRYQLFNITDLKPTNANDAEVENRVLQIPAMKHS